MTNNDLKKGLIFGILAIIFVGLQPIVANSRPSCIDFYIFSAMTGIFEVAIFLPLVIAERKKLQSLKESSQENIAIIDSKLNGWKRNKKFLLFIGLIFTIVPILLILGYELAGSINGSLVLKSEILFSLFFGLVILKEKITKIQIFFSFFLLFGLIIVITQGSFNLLDFNIGVIILFIDVFIYIFGHTITKIRFDKNELTPFQVAFVRNAISGVVLISTYFIFFPFENIALLLNPVYYIHYILMGIVYGFGLLCYYKTISYMPIGQAVILISLSIIVSAFFGSILLGEEFTIFHLIGMCIVIFSIVIIIREKN